MLYYYNYNDYKNNRCYIIIIIMIITIWLYNCGTYLCSFPGFMTRDERKKFEGLQSPYNKYWIPCVWFTNLVAVARCEGRIKDDCTLKLIIEVISLNTHTHTQVLFSFCILNWTDSVEHAHEVTEDRS